MRYNLLFQFVALATLVSPVLAQNYTDALRFNQNNIEGTARSQAMAGAFGSLGADLSSMVSNPAGMGVYRATELGLGFGVNVVSSESDYWGTKTSQDRTKVPFNTIGVNFNASSSESSTGLVSSNLFIAYNRLADYNSLSEYRDPYAFNSLLDYFCTDQQKTAAMTGDLAYNAYLTNDDSFIDDDGNERQITYNVWENYLGNGILDDSYRYDSGDGSGLVNIRKRIKTTGRKGEFGFGYAANVSNKVYIGGSLNVVTYDYDEVVMHREYFDAANVAANTPLEYTYKSFLDQDGAGVNFKLGLIVRPVDFLRVGFAIHSPTFMSISEKYWAQISSDYSSASTDDFEYEYRYRCPSRIVASVSAISSFGLVSFDYERSNNARSKFRSKDDVDFDDDFDSLNDAMRNDILKATNTFRLGLELSALNPLYLRLGGRVSTSALNDDYYYNKPVNFAISGGIGYRVSYFFVDLSYTGATTKGDSWVLPDSNENYVYEDNQPALLTQKSHYGALTIGLRF